MDLYHLYIVRNPGVDRESLEKILGSANSWVRYHENCYVLESSEAFTTWKERLLPIFKPDGYLFICKLDKKNYQGWMQKTFWEWYEARLS